jgi:hypothetical protein
MFCSKIVLGITLVFVSTSASAQQDDLDDLFEINVDAEMCRVLDAFGQPVPMSIPCDIRYFSFHESDRFGRKRTRVSAAARFATDPGTPYTNFRCSTLGATCTIVYRSREFVTGSCRETLSDSSYGGELNCQFSQTVDLSDD